MDWRWDEKHTQNYDQLLDFRLEYVSDMVVPFPEMGTETGVKSAPPFMFAS